MNMSELMARSCNPKVSQVLKCIMDIPDGAKGTNKLQSLFISLLSTVQQNF
jgi:hypothetical protein